MHHPYKAEDAREICKITREETNDKGDTFNVTRIFSLNLTTVIEILDHVFDRLEGINNPYARTRKSKDKN